MGQLELYVGLGALALIVGFPLLLLCSIWLLARLEEWTLQPDERAAEVAELLDRAEPDEVEAAVTRLLADAGSVADRPTAPVRRRRFVRARRRRVVAERMRKVGSEQVGQQP